MFTLQGQDVESSLSDTECLVCHMLSMLSGHTTAALPSSGSQKQPES